MKTIEEFKGFYQSDLLEVLNKLEAQRKKDVGLAWYIIGAGVLAAIIILITFPIGLPWGTVIVAGAGFVITAIVLGIKLNRRRKEAKAIYKQEVIRKMIEFVSPDLSYEASAHISKSEFTGSKIFLKGIDRYNGDDLVEGRIGKTDVRFSEVHAEYYTKDKDGKKSYHTIFRGIFFIADFHKDFIGETVVLPDTAESIFGKIGTWLQKMNISRPQLIKLEDPLFEKEFAVYGTDQVEARYILTPAMMSRIMDFKKKSGKISMSFLHSKVYLAISVSKNLFEPPFFKSMLDFELVREYFNYLILSVNIVEDLDLNTRIWSKE